MSETEKPEQSPLKRALFAVKDLTARLEIAERARVEPIAIVGMGCRFPGSASSPSSFWELLSRGESAIGEVPAERWDIDAYYDPDPDKPGRMYTRRGGFVRDADRFDPRFFGISPREAHSMDPQQRLLLEVAWEALEHAAVNPADLAGSSAGVFIGISVSDYGLMLSTGAGQARDLYSGTGNALSVAAGRLSYFLGFNGPALAVDTACSSSLMSVHLAMQSLRHDECTVALAGGVSLMFSPEATVLACRGHMLAPDGACKTFDARADGYVRGEGCGIVVLKRLRDAVASGDRVLAVLRGSAANQDGRSAGLTVPNGAAQEALLRSALHDARMAATQVGYVEAHGTGTNLGDPIEMRAIQSVYCAGRAPQSPLRVGSVKTNIGHLEPAAGIAGLIKVVSALVHGAIPANLNFETPNPNIPWADVPVEIPTRLLEWPRGAEPRCAGVSAFGFSGTNVHVIVQEAPADDSGPGADAGGARLLTLSARTEHALKQQADNFARHVEGQDAAQFARTCFTANAGRARFEHRLALVASSAEEARAKLRRFAVDASGVAAGTAARAPRVAFLYTGQGSQYAGMGRQLFESESVYREAIEECDQILGAIDGRGLIDVLYRTDAAVADPLLQQTGYAQPALFAVEYGLTRLWRSWGVEPAAVLGHSVGEYAAACAAGVFTLRDGLTLLAARARLMQSLPSGGGMLAVTGEESRVRALIDELSAPVSIAAINGREDLVLSGDLAALRALDEPLQVAGMTTKLLNVSHAFHSSLMQPMLDDFAQVASGLTYRAPAVRLMSNVTGRPVSVEEPMDAGYWRRHVLAPVQFGPSLEALRGQKYDVFVEIGPHPVLAGLGRKADAAKSGAWFGSLRRGKDDRLQITETVGDLFVRGLDFDARALASSAARHKVALPTYPFQRERCWVETAPASVPDRQAARPDTGLPGVAVDAPRNGDLVSTEDWLYEIAWKPAAAPIASPDPLGHWLVFGDRSGSAAAVVAEFARAGAACTTVRAGAAYREEADGFVINPGDRGDMRRLLTEVSARTGRAPAGVAHLWSLDLASTGDAVPGQLLDAGVDSLLNLVQASTDTDQTRPARLLIVTRGAQAAAGASLMNPMQAPSWGLARTIASEHPELGCQIVDFEPNGDAIADAAQLFAEIAAARPLEPQLAYREGARLSPHLVRATPGESTAESVVPFSGECVSNATYLVTGGTGGLGLLVARWLVDRGARHLVLVSRSGASADAAAAITALEQAGAAVTVARADVANDTQLSDVFARIPSALPLRGIVHAAGCLDDGVLRQLTRERLALVMDPKVRGAWHLHQLSRDIALDFFVLFSSGAAVFGSPGQGNYAAGNAFLDALSHYRRARQLPGISINWGAWSGVGMAARLESRERARLSAAGMAPIDPTSGLDALRKALQRDRAQIAVLPIDWAAFARQFKGAAVPPLVAGLAAAASRPTTLRSDATSPDALRQRLLACEPEGRAPLVQAYMAGQLASVLGLNGDEVDPQQPITEMGLDSLMAVELKNRVEADLGTVLPVVDLLKGPNVNELVGLVLPMLAHDAPVVARPEAAADLVEVGEF